MLVISSGNITEIWVYFAEMGVLIVLSGNSKCSFHSYLLRIVAFLRLNFAFMTTPALDLLAISFPIFTILQIQQGNHYSLSFPFTQKIRKFAV